MHCPDCHTLLRSTPGAAWEACPACGGEWFELSALALQLRGAGAGLAGSREVRTAVRTEGVGDPPRPAAPPGRRCPVCRALLRSREWAGASPPHAVALCPLAHGAWLPAGDRARLRRAAERARQLLESRTGYFAFLARAAAREFERAARPGRRARARWRRPLLARLFA